MIRQAWLCALMLLTTLTAVAQEPIDKLIAQLNQSIPGGRVDAARQLARHGQAASAAMEPLITALGDTQADMRLVAAYALGCVQNAPERVLKALVPLLADPDEHVRYSAQWSTARIAAGLNAELDQQHAAELNSILTRAIRETRNREHQTRHLIAMELAQSRIQQLMAPRVITVPAPVPTGPTPEQLQAQAMIESMVQASDLVGRYQLVRKLAQWEAYPDGLRKMFLTKESQQADPSVFFFALERWGRPGQELLSVLLAERLASGILLPEDEPLLTELVPWSVDTQRALLKIVSNSSQPGEIRWSAATALGRCPQIDATVLSSCLSFASDEANDASLRGAVLESLCILGSQVEPEEERLLKLLTDNREEGLRGIIARALASAAPTSNRAMERVRAEIVKTEVDSPQFIDFVEALGEFGPTASECRDQLARGLRHPDEFTRLKCVTALARIGGSTDEVVRELLDHLVDPSESMSVKNEIAAALQSLDVTGMALATRINRALVAEDQTALGDLFQAVATMKWFGDHSDSPHQVSNKAANILVSDCLSVLASPRYLPATRAAAATALGSLGPRAQTAVLKLSELCQKDSEDELRSACLIAVAQIDPDTADKLLSTLNDDQSILMQTAAAFARHLVGDSRQALDELLGLLDDSPSDEVIASAIGDMGEVTNGWLVEVASDTSATRAARLTAYRLACEAPAPQWDKLLPLLDDSELGDMFVACAEGPVQTSDGIESILSLIESQRLRPAAQARAAGMLSPDGLGAGDSAQDWQGLTLQQPEAVKSLARSAAAPQSVESAPEPIGSGGGPETIVKSPPQPPMPLQAVPTALAEPTAEAKLVDVFYGTNRGRVVVDNPHQKLAISVLATAGGGMLAMVICLFGFIRSGNRLLALIALLAIGIAAPFGYQAAQQYTHDSMEVAVNYDGTYRKEIELGLCQVSIPPGHQPGELEAPNMFKLEFKQELDKHVVLTEVRPLEKDRFYEALQGSLGSHGKHLLVFIHGYNVSFEDAARRTAQMAYDLKFPGAPVFYSWPSQANWYGYPTDRKNIELSVTQIKEFLVDIAQRSGAESINLVAHSMGNVGLTAALKEMEQTGTEPMFNQVVLAAPDIDADVFRERIAPSIVTRAKHVTLYTSQTDLALIASRYFNQGPRVGDSANGVLLLPGIETIDATSVDSSLIGHSYYGSNVSVLTDLGNVLNNQPAGNRGYLQAVDSQPVPYWTFDVAKISQGQTNVTR